MSTAAESRRQALPAAERSRCGDLGHTVGDRTRDIVVRSIHQAPDQDDRRPLDVGGRMRERRRGHDGRPSPAVRRTGPGPADQTQRCLRRPGRPVAEDRADPAEQVVGLAVARRARS